MWEEREREFIAELKENARWYEQRAGLNRVWHVSLSLVVIVCGVLAPLAAVSASGAVSGASTANGLDLRVLGVSAQSMAQISIVITIILGIAEGLRRFFRFEHHWRSFYTSGLTLHYLHSAYLDGQLNHEVGSPTWVENYSKAKQTMQALVQRETEAYFAAMFTPATGRPP